MAYNIISCTYSISDKNCQLVSSIKTEFGYLTRFTNATSFEMYPELQIKLGTLCRENENDRISH